jgi:putative membrane protein
MKVRHSTARLGTVLLPVALVLGISACNLPNEPITHAAAEMSEPITSGQILQVLYALNQGEIEQAELALQRSSNPEVYKTAQLIIKDHMVSNQRIVAIAQAIGVELEESPLSQGMQLQAGAIKEGLEALSGAEFDRAYLENQVELHALALETARSQLLPNAQDPQVKYLLMTAAPKLELHRQEAQESHASLAQHARR